VGRLFAILRSCHVLAAPWFVASVERVPGRIMGMLSCLRQHVRVVCFVKVDTIAAPSTFSGLSSWVADKSSWA
jgi:hypothetical protein